eukprot:evm.model.NODE_18227_length_1762_cov_28.377979.1
MPIALGAFRSLREKVAISMKEEEGEGGEEEWVGENKTGPSMSSQYKTGASKGGRKEGGV